MVQQAQVSVQQGQGLFCVKEHPFLCISITCISCQLTETEATFPYHFEQFH